MKNKNDQEICTVSGRPITDDSFTIDPNTGLQNDYIVLSENERAKGFIRPYRDSYKHVGIRPKYPLRDLTHEEHERYELYNYTKFEAYPEDESLVGRFWTEAQLNSGCGTITTMNRSLSETYARDNKFYGATYCCGCKTHIPVEEFVWVTDGQVVGS